MRVFRGYLSSLSNDLLESVTEDYVWLSGLDFRGARSTDFRHRRECCREECLRRGEPGLYSEAERGVWPSAA
ncbi:MAG TPA: hypothetical protein VKB88_25960 [Bryobacteraceae bacterium]|nr:hypothetical protein [Bryobacteraceae bacterium]